MRKRSGKFVLAEILVVAVLLALLAVPFVSLVRRVRVQQEQVATCMSNQRQFAAAFMWAQEDRGTLPAADNGWITRLDIPVHVLSCPVDPHQSIGYVYNARVGGKTLGGIADPARTLLTGDGYSPGLLAHTAADFIPRHQGKIVASYVDGHVALVAPAGYQKLLP